jgi:hypothetical protein
LESPGKEVGADAPGREGKKKKREGRPPIDIFVLLCVTMYGYMQGNSIYLKKLMFLLSGLFLACLIR